MSALTRRGAGRTRQGEGRRHHQDINRRFATEGYNLWLQWVEWSIGTAPDVHGVVMDPTFPTAASRSPAWRPATPRAGALGAAVTF